MSVTGTLTITASALDVSTTNTLAAQGDTIVLNETYALNYSPTSPDPAIAVQWSGAVVLTAAPTSLDLTALTGARGQTVTFATVRALYLYNTSTADPVTVGNGTNPFTPGWSSATNTEALPPDSRIVWENRTASAGWTVSGGAKTVKLDPGAATCTVRVVIWGS